MGDAVKNIVFSEERVFPAEDTSHSEALGFVEEELEKHDCPENR